VPGRVPVFLHGGNPQEAYTMPHVLRRVENNINVKTKELLCCSIQFKYFILFVIYDYSWIIRGCAKPRKNVHIPNIFLMSLPYLRRL